MTPAARFRSPRSTPWLVVIGVLVAALSLRGPIVAPTPVLRDIETDLGVGPATVGLLTTAPVLMFAVLTPIAALVIRRSGPERALLVSLTGVLVGTLVRAVPGFGWMLAGMIVIGAAITIGNVVIPVIIRRDVPRERVGLVTAAYTAMLNAGSLVTSLFTAPIAEAIGWPLALLVWSGMTVAGVLVWGAHLRRSGDAPGERYSGEPDTRPVAVPDLDPATITGPLPLVRRSAERSMLRRPIAWLLVATFSGQTVIYFGFTTWLPTIAADELGLDAAAAGALTSLFHGVAIAGAFLVPLLARFAPVIVPVLVICASWLVLTFGALLLPQLLAVWLSVGAVAHAGGFVVVFTLLVGVARSDGEAAGMSALVQGGGYAVGAMSAPVAGALHEATGAWTASLALFAAVAVVYGILMVSATAVARRR